MQNYVFPVLVTDAEGYYVLKGWVAASQIGVKFQKFRLHLGPRAPISWLLSDLQLLW